MAIAKLPPSLGGSRQISPGKERALGPCTLHQRSELATQSGHVTLPVTGGVRFSGIRTDGSRLARRWCPDRAMSGCPRSAAGRPTLQVATVERRFPRSPIGNISGVTSSVFPGVFEFGCYSSCDASWTREDRGCDPGAGWRLRTSRFFHVAVFGFVF